MKRVEIDGAQRLVILDLLTDKYDPSTGKSRRHGKIQDAAPLKAEGVDMAFKYFVLR